MRSLLSREQPAIRVPILDCRLDSSEAFDGWLFFRRLKRRRLRSRLIASRQQEWPPAQFLSKGELERAEIRPLKEIEREAILVAVKQLGVSGAASVLGVGRTTIHRKLRSYQAGSPEPEPGWRAVPVTKVNALLAAAAKAAEFLRWCQGTMAPRLGERLDAAIQDFQEVAVSRRHPKHYKTTRGTS